MKEYKSLEYKDLYDIAKALLEKDVKDFNYNPVEYIKSMGWNVENFYGIDNVSIDIGKKDIEKVMDFIDEYVLEYFNKNNIEEASFSDIFEYLINLDEVQDFITNFIAEKIIKEYNKLKHTKINEKLIEKEIMYKNYDVMGFINEIDKEYELNLSDEDKTELYHYANDDRWADKLTPEQFENIIILWADSKWHKDWDPSMLKVFGTVVEKLIRLSRKSC